MKKDKFKDFRYTCLKCGSIIHITVYLQKNMCIICEKPLTKRLMKQMRKRLKKDFVKRCKIFEKAEGYYKNSLRGWIEKYIFR